MGTKHKIAMPGHGRGVFGAPLFCSVYGPRWGQATAGYGRLRRATTTAYGERERGERGGERGGFEKNRRMVDREMMDQEKVDQGHCRMKVVMNGQGGSSEVG